MIPPPPHDYKVKVTNLKNLPKFYFFLVLKQPLHATHFPKLLDKMCKYEMDPTSMVEDTERTRFCPQTDRRTDGQGETSIPTSTSLKRRVWKSWLELVMYWARIGNFTAHFDRHVIIYLCWDHSWTMLEIGCLLVMDYTIKSFFFHNHQCAHINMYKTISKWAINRHTDKSYIGENFNCELFSVERHFMAVDWYHAMVDMINSCH